MYVRFVRLPVEVGKEAAFAAWYRDRVIPALGGAQGCLFAGLLTPWQGDEHRSLTIWRTSGAAGAYERSGLYRELLAEAEPMLARRIDWLERPPDDEERTGEVSEARIRELPPEGFVVDAGDGAAARLGSEIETAFVRMVSVRVAPDRIGEFVSAYSNRILPAVRRQAGFRGGLLAEEAGDEGGFLSITLWEREQDALRYETSGEFAALTDSVKETFSPIYSFASALSGSGEDPLRQIPKVSSYRLVMGKRLVDGRR